MCTGNKDTWWKEKRDGWRLRGQKASKWWMLSRQWTLVKGCLCSILKCKIGRLYGTTGKEFGLEDTKK